MIITEPGQHSAQCLGRVQQSLRLQAGRVGRVEAGRRGQAGVLHTDRTEGRERDPGVGRPELPDQVAGLGQ